MSRAAVTYFGFRSTQCPEMALAASALLPRSIDCFHLGILGVRRDLYVKGMPYLYDRRFRLQCGAKGASAFLTTAGKKIALTSSVTLYYTFPSSLGTVGTDDYAWRSLMNQLRHELACIRSIEGFVDEAFWDLAVWQSGITAVLEQGTLRHNYPFQGENAFYQLGKLASRELRHVVGREADKSLCGKEDLVLIVLSAPQKRAFAIALENVIHWEMT